MCYSIPVQNVRFVIKTCGQFKDILGQLFNSELDYRVSVDTVTLT